MTVLKKRLEIIDCFRGLAAVSVIFYHYTFMFRTLYGHNYSPLFDYKFGVEGVCFFFIISGFVIFYSLEKTENCFVFLYNRFFRLYPAYWFCVTLTFSSCLLINPNFQGGCSTKQFLFNLTMFQSWFKLKDIDGAYWSLVPELRFYFLVVLVLLFKLKESLFPFLLIWTLLSVLNQIHIIYYLSSIIELNYSFFFIAGIIFYKKWIKQSDIKLNFILAVNVLLALVYHSKSLGSLIVIIIAFLLFFTMLEKPDFITGWIFRIFKFFGEISFPLYLTHQVMGFMLMNSLIAFFSGINSVYFIFVSFVFFTLLSYFITKFIEKPGIRFGKYLIQKTYKYAS